MPAKHEVFPDLRLVRTRVDGVLTERETREHYERIQRDPAFDPTFRQLCDLTGVKELQASAEFLRELARMAVFARGTRRAFVAPAPLHFGLVRMFQAYCELDGTEIEVFRSLEEAERWLGLKSP